MRNALFKNEKIIGGKRSHENVPTATDKNVVVSPQKEKILWLNISLNGKMTVV